MSSREEVELSGSRGTAHFAMKWARDARQQANLQVVEDIKGVTLEWPGAFVSCFSLVRGTVVIRRKSPQIKSLAHRIVIQASSVPHCFCWFCCDYERGVSQSRETRHICRSVRIGCR